MTVLNVLLSPERLVVVVDTLVEDAASGAPSLGAKALLVPQHNIVLAARGSARLLLQVYQILLQAGYRPGFNLEQALAEMGPLIDQIWPAFEAASVKSGVHPLRLGTELVLGGWSVSQDRMLATAYAKNSAGQAAVVQPLVGGMASPGEPLRGRADSFEAQDLLESGRMQVRYLNTREGRRVSGGSLLMVDLTDSRAVISDLGKI